IFGVTRRGSRLSGVLGARPLVEVGRRSYSLYLWHWPVYVVTRPGLDLPWSSGPTLVLRMALSASLAELSYRFVEVPVRRGALGRGWRRVQANARLATPPRRRQLRRSWGAIGVGALSLLLLLGVAAARTTAPPPLDSLLSTDGDSAGPGDDAGAAAGPLVAVGSGAPAKPDVTVTTSLRDLDPNRIPITDVAAAGSSGTGGGAVRVVAIGDSVMLGARTALTDTIPGIAVNARVGRYMSEGRTLLATLAARNAMPEAIVVHLGTNGPASEADVRGIIDAAGGRPVVFVTVKAPRRWESTSNSSITAGAAGQANVRIVDWKKASGSCKGTNLFYDDGIHLKPAGAACYATLIRAALA
ncbi:MAG: acyltransferase family protein, partial [Acidimicrobiales bacterium]